MNGRTNAATHRYDRLRQRIATPSLPSSLLEAIRSMSAWSKVEPRASATYAAARRRAASYKTGTIIGRAHTPHRDRQSFTYLKGCFWLKGGLHKRADPATWSSEQLKHIGVEARHRRTSARIGLCRERVPCRLASVKAVGDGIKPIPLMG